MSDLPEYVAEHFAHAVKQDLATWLLRNPLPTICEAKIDGIRVFLFKSGDKLVISSKHGAMYTPQSSPKVFTTIPEFLHAPHQMILDGEYVARKGALYLFDVLNVDGRDVRSLPLTERKKILREILKGTGLEVPYKLAKSVEEVLALKDRFVKEGYEGIVAKSPQSAHGQPGAWLKMKRYDTVDVFIIDYEKTQDMERTGVPRSWFVGVYDDDGHRVPLGKVGAFVEKVDPRKVVKGAVVEVRYQEVTEDTKLRGAFILRVRHDKVPGECLLSQLK
jgi:bifunctional non-homologous end joining protein LigD